jgi:hypothetical protein
MTMPVRGSLYVSLLHKNTEVNIICNNELWEHSVQYKKVVYTIMFEALYFNYKWVPITSYKKGEQHTLYTTALGLGQMAAVLWSAIV